MVKQRTQTDNQTHGREIDSFQFGQADRIFPVFFTVGT